MDIVMATHKIQSSGQIQLDRKQKAPQPVCICIASVGACWNQMATQNLQSSGQIQLDRRQKRPNWFAYVLHLCWGMLESMGHVTNVDPKGPLWPACWNPENHMPTVLHVYCQQLEDIWGLTCNELCYNCRCWLDLSVPHRRSG